MIKKNFGFKCGGSLFDVVLASLLALSFRTQARAATAADLADEVRLLSSVSNGLCVQVGFSSADLMTRLAQSGQFVVHGIAASRDAVAVARASLLAEGLGGLATVGTGAPTSIPLVNDLANLLVIEDVAPLLAGGLPVAEMVRVLAPDGVACLGVPGNNAKTAAAALAQAGLRDVRQVNGSRAWLVFRKPRPAAMDEWTHPNHGPDRNPVSHDTLIGPPDTIRWCTGPTHPTPRVEKGPAYGQVIRWVSSGGRNFYLMNNDTIVARNGYNGLMLWTAPVGSSHILMKGMIATEKKVFASNSKEVLVLDAATGAPLYSLPGQAWIMVAVSNRLIGVNQKSITGFDVASTNRLWTLAWPNNRPDGNPPVAADGRLFLLAGPMMTAVDIGTGSVAWKVDVSSSAGTNARLLFAQAGMLLTRRSAGGVNDFCGLSTADGKTLWNYTTKPAPKKGSTVSEEAFCAGGVLWLNDFAEDGRSIWNGLNLRSGARVQVVPSRFGGSGCHTMCMTDLYAIGRRPCNFMSWMDGTVTTNGGARGACSLSVGLANGQFYMLQSNVPFGCVCGPFEAGISGWAADKSNPVSEAPDRLETAAAPMTAGAGSDLSADASWPMFRHDGRRSSCTSNTVPDALAIRWSRKVAVGKWPDTILRRDWELRVPSGHFLSGPTLAEGRVFASLTEAGAAMALDAKDGRVLWSFPMGGRLDTPPSIVNGVALAGSHDGSVYALDAATGKLQWRFRAAPIERRLLAYGQIESSWPVVGGVLLEQGTAYVIAGRTTEIDSGLFVHALDPKTGQLLWSRRRPLPPGDKSASWNIFRGWADLLACDGRAIAIAGCPRGRFDPKTGDVPREPGLPKYTAPVAVGLNYVSRNLYGNGPGEYPPSPVIFNDQFVCRPFIRFEGDKPRVRASGLVARLHGAKPDEKIWQVIFPPGVVVESLVMAGDRILAAVAITSDGKRSGELQLFSAKDGARVGSLPLPAAPVFEGLAVGREGRVFASLEDGTIVCLAAP